MKQTTWDLLTESQKCKQFEQWEKEGVIPPSFIIMSSNQRVQTNTALVIFNRFNAIPRKGKSFKKRSLTVPQMDIKVSDLLKAYQQGMINSSNDPQDAEWNDDNPFAIGIDPRRLDLTELAIYKEQMENHINDLSQKMHDKVKEGKTKLEEIKKAEAEKLKIDWRDNPKNHKEADEGSKH